VKLPVVSEVCQFCGYPLPERRDLLGGYHLKCCGDPRCMAKLADKLNAELNMLPAYMWHRRSKKDKRS